MQRMMCISEKQYNRMIGSYDGAMKELQELKEMLQAIQGDMDGVTPIRLKNDLISKVIRVLQEMDEDNVRRVYLMSLGLRSGMRYGARK